MDEGGGARRRGGEEVGARLREEVVVESGQGRRMDGLRGAKSGW